MAVSTADIEFLDPPLLEGELGRLGPYRVTGLLGVGGMGQVFQAEDTRLRRTVAIKVMNPKFASTNHSRKRFVAEARSMAAIHHDNVAVIFEVGQHQRTPYMAMELLHGRTIEQWVQEGRHFDHFEIIEIAKQTALGLDAAHQRGIVHRDIKPANLWMQSPQDRIKILDFGLALMGNGIDRLSGVGSVVGTLGYLSPEQASNDPVDERTDLYGLGVVMYQLCTGQLPCVGDKVASQLIAIINQPPIPFVDHGIDVPELLGKLILQLLSKDPHHRVATAKQLVDRLDAVADEIRHGKQRLLDIKVAPDDLGAGKSRKRSRRRGSKKQSERIDTPPPENSVSEQNAVPLREQPSVERPGESNDSTPPNSIAGTPDVSTSFPGDVTSEESAESPPIGADSHELDELELLDDEESRFGNWPWIIVSIVSATLLTLGLGSYLWFRPNRAAQVARPIVSDQTPQVPAHSNSSGESRTNSVSSAGTTTSANESPEVTVTSIAPIVLKDEIEGSRSVLAGNFTRFSLRLANEATSEDEDPRRIHQNAKKVVSIVTYLQQEGSSNVTQPAFPQHVSAKRLPPPGQSSVLPVQFPTQGLTPGKYTVRFELQIPNGRKVMEQELEFTVKPRK
ncbi:serine/threonine-protein kinase [Aporhodopirellula aestuarii]|uniref:Serine/threonine protein kinase n=1 Tax=Aporhodopirellula aestuarii TaxID=2950107 RepID=A0ABT0U3J8_9BACT|nr:serine/threonine-protein kinase [Aporhodopirellula aestuarii]MCM2371489.1 serine/threonine protein kinase [Aporhodopirellula aestuarii]